MGCGWLHSADDNVLADRVEAEGLTLDQTPPPWRSQAFDHEMTPTDQAAFGEAFAAFDQRVAEAATRGEDRPASDFFDPDSRWNAHMDAISGALNGARFAEVSSLDYDAYGDTGVNWRVREGYGRLIARLGQAAAPVHGDGLRRAPHRPLRPRAAAGDQPGPTDRAHRHPDHAQQPDRQRDRPHRPAGPGPAGGDGGRAAGPGVQGAYDGAGRGGFPARHPAVDPHRHGPDRRLSPAAVRAADDRGLFRRRPGLGAGGRRAGGPGGLRRRRTGLGAGLGHAPTAGAGRRQRLGASIPGRRAPTPTPCPAMRRIGPGCASRSRTAFSWPGKRPPRSITARPTAPGWRASAPPTPPCPPSASRPTAARKRPHREAGQTPKTRRQSDRQTPCGHRPAPPFPSCAGRPTRTGSRKSSSACPASCPTPGPS